MYGERRHGKSSIFDSDHDQINDKIIIFKLSYKYSLVCADSLSTGNVSVIISVAGSISISYQKWLTEINMSVVY